MDLRELAKVVWRRLWLVALIVMIACLTAGAVTIWLIPPTYEASTKLIVNKSAVEDGEAVINWDVVTVNIQLIDTYKELIKTAAIMDEVLLQHPDLDLTRNELIDKVDVSSVNNTQVMTVVAQDESYESAARIVNAVSQVFQAKVIEILRVDNVIILNEAHLDEVVLPVSPSLTMNVAISFILSMMFGLGLAFLLEHLDDSIKNEEDVQKALGLPFLASIHRMEKKDFNRQKAAKAARKAGDIYVATNQP
jgi:capsular polysaccharide biosynthesis protein